MLITEFCYANSPRKEFGTKPYVTERPQVAQVNRKFSKSEIVTSGVAQGSILDLLFFLVFIDDRPNHCKNIITLLFANLVSINVGWYN